MGKRKKIRKLFKYIYWDEYKDKDEKRKKVQK